jgi:transposase
MKAEILVGPERRRRWSVEEKLRIVVEAAAPGAQVAEIARRCGISRSLLYTWRRQAHQQQDDETLPGLVPAVIVPAADGVVSGAAGLAPENGVIEIALAGGVRVTVRGRVDAKGLRAVLTALRPE